MKYADMGEVGGKQFLDNIFFITDGIMLSQVKSITGVDGSTLQNWVKRGWVSNSVNKRYSKEQLARILIINMIRGSMQLERIDYILRYINGSSLTHEDDIIADSELYGYICDIIARLSADDGIQNNLETVDMYITESVRGFNCPIPGAEVRLKNALKVVIAAYYASLIQNYSNRLFEQLRK